MKTALSYKIASILTLITASLGVIYCVYGIYMFVSINRMLFFLTPAYGGLLILVLFFVGFLALALLGCRLLQKQNGDTDSN